MIGYIDTEVSPQSKKVLDYGAVREDGAMLHTSSYKEFRAFVSKCDTLCGHNILQHDLKYIGLNGNFTYIDTLPLSPLLFPKKPYHRLVKDDKLQVDELNNPVNDAKKAQNLFADEVAAWEALPSAKKEIFYHLLYKTTEFGGFFKHLAFTPTTKRASLLERALLSDTGLEKQILTEYRGKICENANIGSLAKQTPIELAYALAVIGADDTLSMTPAWVVRNYPRVANALTLLRERPCGKCIYCQNRLDAHQGLRDFFGYDQFRTFDGVPMQQQAVEAALRGESMLTIFPTGGGKSLTFQLPALMAGRNSHGLTVIISPLQSLMKDQVDNLAERGISDAVAINGLLDPLERAAAIEQVADGTANLLYIAPEMLRSKTIERLLLNRNVARFVVDEAHCFSAWGQDFRVDYLYIGDFIKHLQEQKPQGQPIAVSCFTATAKQKVISDIRDYFRQKLGLELKLFAAKAERSNLRYSVIHADTPEEKYHQLRSLILGRSCPTIVYVSRTKRTHELANHLRADGIAALPFNGKMEAADKVHHQNAFMNGEVQVMVATSAFGMGVDKKDVGLVVHYDISDSLENYVQEAGRAGRDPRMQADCYVLFSDSDLDKHFILLNQTKLSISEIQQVWKALKDLTPTRPQLNCTPLEIARQAGWSEEVDDLENRVKAAVSALENAGFVKRGSNTPHVFATGIKVANMDEARQRLTLSPLFDETTREEAARIIRSLISSRATSSSRDGEAESRVDYLADILGMSKDSVIRNINLMRQEGLLADSRDMQAWIDKSNIARSLEKTLQLEKFLLEHLSDETTCINYKKLNEEAQNQNLANSTVKRLRTLVYFLSVKGYIQKSEKASSGNVEIRTTTSPEATLSRFARRADLCRFVVEKLCAQAEPKQTATSASQAVEFSLVELLQRYINEHNTLQFGETATPTVSDIEEALLYLSKTDLMKLDGGFLVIYNSMQLHRIAERRARYGKEQYRMLDEFYKHRIQQIHIVGEYANLMVSDYGAALGFVNDYFNLDFKVFVSKYFKGERKAEIANNITPVKYQKLFGEMSSKQLEIINDKQSKYIVVAAGPGSGKTRVLVHKLASLMQIEDVKHEQMLMLTFSRSATTEFKKRLLELAGNAAHFVDIKTFHSYCFDLLGKQGNLDNADKVVRTAAEMIGCGEVEEAKIAKSVLVIDEAQDMSDDDFMLVKALMQRNEEMRVIAVGDDDQNIYGFRGSKSAHMQSLIHDYNATLYEMVQNYRSARAIVNYANHFTQRFPNRIKHNPIEAVTSEEGVVSTLPFDNKTTIQHTEKGTTAILTRTNEEAMQMAYSIELHGKHAKLIMANDKFRFGNLAEVRYFLKQLNQNERSATISEQQWQNAKQRTLDTYANSNCINLMKRFFTDFETTHKTFYSSDLKEFIFESDIDDFISTDDNTVFVSTIHKSKGREFDTVYLLPSDNPNEDAEMLRVTYVGITRAKKALYLLTPSTIADSTQLKHIAIALTMRDVWLDYFKERKNSVLRLRSGDTLRYSNGYLISKQEEYVACLSNAMRERVAEMQQKGYHVTSAKVTYILAWKPQEETQEYAVCLANLYLQRM